MQRTANMENGQKKERNAVWRETVTGIVITTGVLVLFTLLSHVLFEISSETGHIDISALLMLAVLLIARWTSGYFWGILASVVGVIVINIMYIYPYRELNFFIEGYPIVFVCLITVAIITSALSGRIKKQLQQSRKHEEIAHQTSEFSKKLMMVSGFEPIIRISLEHLHCHIDSAILYVPDQRALDEGRETIFEGQEKRDLQPEERAAMLECFRTKQECGFGTARCPHAQFRFFPLVSHSEMLGAVGIRWDPGIDNELTLRIRMSLGWTALALERQKLEDQANHIAMEAEREAMRNNLLRSISHDIRTPLTGIIGATAAILENNVRIDEENTLKLMHDVKDDAEWLLRMTENLLSVSRLTGDGVSIKKQCEVVEEVVAEAVSRCKRRLPEAVISVKVPDELLFVPMEATLIEQVLINLIENGVRHGKSPVEITVRQERSDAVFLVRDFGEGFRPEVQSTLFNGVGHKKPETGRGLGIGLSLCKSIIAAHGGTIEGINHEEGGALFRFTLPMEDEEETDEIQ